MSVQNPDIPVHICLHLQECGLRKARNAWNCEVFFLLLLFFFWGGGRGADGDLEMILLALLAMFFFLIFLLANLRCLHFLHSLPPPLHYLYFKPFLSRPSLNLFPKIRSNQFTRFLFCCLKRVSLSKPQNVHRGVVDIFSF